MSGHDDEWGDGVDDENDSNGDCNCHDDDDVDINANNNLYSAYSVWFMSFSSCLTRIHHGFPGNRSNDEIKVLHVLGDAQ